MKTLKCCVVDDEPLASGLIASYVRRTPFMQLGGEFSSADEAAAAILGGDFDVVFLDIRMPGLSGIEFARMIGDATKVIFTTAYDNYALEGFRVNALDYLLKPVSYEEFLEAARRALAWHSHRVTATADPQEKKAADVTHIIVKSDYRHVQIAVDDILYLESLRDYVKIVLSDNQKPVMTLMSLKAIEAMLPADRFLRIHRSYVVNARRITVIERSRVAVGDAVLPVSDSCRAALSDYIGA